MGSAPPAPPLPSPAFLAAFRRAAGPSGRLSFANFMQLALYDAEVGYYRQPRRRVGYGGDTDFFTASTSGPIFGELVVAAVTQLLRAQGCAPGDFTFVEVGVEPGTGGVLHAVEHPFAAVHCRHSGEPLGLPIERCVVFSNELFDAQPCARFVADADGWAEVWVEEVAGELRERLQPVAPPGPPLLPAPPAAGYRFDAPYAAAALAEQLAAAAWRGLFLAFDYGKSFAVLANETPQGTLRAYYRHSQSNDLLARPGEQDLTCHVCWDWLSDALSRHGFTVAPVVAQETFLVTHAASLLEQITTGEAAHLSQRKLALLQLLHPAHLGRKFQVLHAWRSPR